MAEFATVSNESKLTYACIKQGVAVLEKIDMFRTVAIAELFPDQATQWDKIKKVLDLGISKKIAWTGMSMTKSDSTPDETRVPPQTEINTNTIRMMYAVATAESVTMNTTDYEFFDPDDNFKESAATWTQAVNAYLEILNLGTELGLYKIAGAEMEGGDAQVNRSPAQLLIFDAVEVPLVLGRNTEEWNPDGIEAGFGTFYEDFFLKSINQLIAGTIPTLDVLVDSDTAGKAEHPTNPGWTQYAFTAPAGYSMVGILQGKDSDGNYRPTAKYTSATEGYIEVQTLLENAPATLTAKLIFLKAT